MNPIRSAVNWAGSLVKRAVSLADFDSWMEHIVGYGGELSAAGVPVTEQTAYNYNPVLAAANILGQELASMDLNIFERQQDGSRTQMDPHEGVAYKLAFEPNPLMSSYTWRLVSMGHLIWRGNAVSLLDWDAAGRLRAIWPLHPDRVSWKMEDAGLLYYVRRRDGSVQQFDAEDVLHFKGVGGDGISGYSLVKMLADSLGIPIAAEQFAGRYFANDATPGVILKHPLKLSPAAHDNIRKSFEARHKGVTNSHVLGIIEEGMTAEVLEVKASDSQLTETRRYGVEDVSRITRIPLHMLGDLSRSTNNNIEHQGLEFGKHCMRPHAKNWEQEINRKLLYGTRQFPEFDLSELYRGDALSRAQANQIKFDRGVLDIDEWRRDDGRNPLPTGAGRLRIVPLNMQSVPGLGLPQLQTKDAPVPQEAK